jgi:hypothetical protein
MSLHRPRAAALAAALTMTALLSACGGDGGDLASSTNLSLPAADAAAAAPAPATAEAEAVAEEAAPSYTLKASTKAAKTGTAAGPARSAEIAAGAGKGSGGKLSIPESALDGREIIYTAEQTIEVEDIAKAVSAIEAAVDAAGGLVAKSERTDGAAHLRMRIPPGAFDSFLTRIGKVGLVLERTVSGDDVTDQVVDVNSRVDSARKSVARVRALMGQASTLRDVVALESELAQRESDLEALLARQAKLKNSTELATVTVHLVTKAKPAPQAQTEETKKGFVAGLDGGWDAFTGSAVALATVLGAVLPFALLLLVLSPVLVLLNRRFGLLARLRTPRPAD